MPTASNSRNKGANVRDKYSLETINLLLITRLKYSEENSFKRIVGIRYIPF